MPPGASSTRAVDPVRVAGGVVRHDPSAAGEPDQRGVGQLQAEHHIVEPLGIGIGRHGRTGRSAQARFADRVDGVDTKMLRPRRDVRQPPRGVRRGTLQCQYCGPVLRAAGDDERRSGAGGDGSLLVVVGYRPSIQQQSVTVLDWTVSSLVDRQLILPGSADRRNDYGIDTTSVHR